MAMEWANFCHLTVMARDPKEFISGGILNEARMVFNHSLELGRFSTDS